MKKIFVSALAFDEGKSGISNYIENSVYHLATQNHIYLAILSSDVKNYTRVHKNIHFIVFPNILKSTLLNLLFHFFILPFWISSKYDFIFLPAGNRRLMIYYPLYTITTFHDLSQFYIQGKYDLIRMCYIKYFIPFFLHGVHKIIAVSHNTKKDMLKYLNIKEDRIVVNVNGFDQKLYKKNQVKPVKVEEEHLLYVSRLEHPGKNHINLIKAYELLPSHIKNKYKLILVGSDCSNAHLIHEYAQQSKFKDNIIFKGFVKNEQMCCLFKQSKLFVFPSLYEGFGIPLIEAMAMGIPTLSAANSSLLEIGKEVSVFFDEKNIHDIKETIIRVIEDETLQEKMKKDGLIRVKQYDWRQHANNIIKIYEQHSILHYSKTYC